MLDASGLRRFAYFPAAVLVFVVDDDDRLLLIAAPHTEDWEVVSGKLEHGETVIDGVMREARDELGPEVRLEP